MTTLMLCIALLLCVLHTFPSPFIWRLALRRWLLFFSLPATHRSKRAITRKPESTGSRAYRCRPKPQWVADEVIRLKAHMPHDGCRKIASTFNRIHKGKELVSKSFVAKVIRNHLYAITIKRHLIRARVPYPCAPNAVWGIDLTGKNDVFGNTHHILGIIDHGSRFALRLEAMPVVTSWTLLLELLFACREYGFPKAIRTDNSSVFTSRLFRFGLQLMGIKHQRTDVGCPWLNGKVERLFGTLKERLKRITFTDHEQLTHALSQFRVWYNEVRVHQHLDGRTPYEAWHDIDYQTQQPKVIEIFSAWDGVISGLRLRW